MKTMQTLELFAGCGGLAKGLELAGFKHAGFLEINHQACESLRANYNPRLVHEMDVKKVDFHEFDGVDLVSGGPPCQPFSLGGLAKANNDARDMFPQAIRAISEIKPKGFIFENVKGLLRTKFAPYFNYIILRLSFPDCRQKEKEKWEDHSLRLQRIKDGGRYDGLRYRVHYKLLNAADYEIPQVRERVFIVGLREDVATGWTWPQKITARAADKIPISAVLGKVPDPQKNSHYAEDHIFIDGARVYPGHTGSDVNSPSKTIKAGAHGVPGGENMLRFADGSVRYMTVHEAKLIQTFPRDYKITGSWGEALRQIGNAVPVQLARYVGEHLYTLLANDPVVGRKSERMCYASPNVALKGEQMLLAVERKKARMASSQKVKGLKGTVYSAGRKRSAAKKLVKVAAKKRAKPAARRSISSKR